MTEISIKKFGIKTIVNISIALVLIETSWRMARSIQTYWYKGLLLMMSSFLICGLASVLNIKDNSFIKSIFFRSFLSILHGLDGVAALVRLLKVFHFICNKFWLDFRFGYLFQEYLVTIGWNINNYESRLDSYIESYDSCQ